MTTDPNRTSAYTVYVNGKQMLDSAGPTFGDLGPALKRWAPVALAIALTAAAFTLISVAWGSYDGPLWLGLSLQLVGIPFILGGAALWVHRHGDYLGPVCVLLGATWYLGDLQAFRQEVPFVIGFVGYFLNVAVFAHLALMVPHGRLVDRVDKWVVGALYVMIPVTQFLRYLDIRPFIDHTTFGNVLAYPSPWARVATLLGAPLAVIAALSVIRHYRNADDVHRRSFRLFWIAAAAVGITATAGAGLEFWQADLPQQIALLGYAVAMVATAVAVVVGAVNVSVSPFDAWQDLTGGVDDLERAIRAAAGDRELCFYTVDSKDMNGQTLWRHGLEVIDGEPPIGQNQGWIELTMGGKKAAVIVHDRELAYQRPVVQAVATMTWAALARLRLTQERNNAAVDAQHAERLRFSRDLHDDVQAMLSTVVLGINRSADRLAQGHPEHAELQRLADTAAAVRSRLVQIAHDVYPKEIRDGLPMMVGRVLDQQKPSRSGIHVTTAIGALPPEADRIRPGAYYLISEALQNVIKHSGATKAWIRVAADAGVVRIDIEDNGKGWTAATDDRVDGNGLENMESRVGLLNGALSLERSPRGGAAVRIRLPLSAAHRQDDA